MLLRPVVTDDLNVELGKMLRCGKFLCSAGLFGLTWNKTLLLAVKRLLDPDVRFWTLAVAFGVNFAWSALLPLMLLVLTLGVLGDRWFHFSSCCTSRTVFLTYVVSATCPLHPLSLHAL